jgi:hypothetical protein
MGGEAGLAPGAPASVLTRRRGTAPTFWVNRRDACQQARARARRCVQREGALSLKNALRSKFRLATYTRPRGRQRPRALPAGITRPRSHSRETRSVAPPPQPPPRCHCPSPTAAASPGPCKGCSPRLPRNCCATRAVRPRTPRPSTPPTAASLHAAPRAPRAPRRAAPPGPARVSAGSRHCFHGAGARAGRGRGAGGARAGRGR